MIGKSGTGKTMLLKTAIKALSELGYFIKSESVYINSYTNEELFGDAKNKSRSIISLFIIYS